MVKKTDLRHVALVRVCIALEWRGTRQRKALRNPSVYALLQSSHNRSKKERE